MREMRFRVRYLVSSLVLSTLDTTSSSDTTSPRNTESASKIKSASSTGHTLNSKCSSNGKSNLGNEICISNLPKLFGYPGLKLKFQHLVPDASGGSPVSFLLYTNEKSPEFVTWLLWNVPQKTKYYIPIPNLVSQKAYLLIQLINQSLIQVGYLYISVFPNEPCSNSNSGSKNESISNNKPSSNSTSGSNNKSCLNNKSGLSNKSGSNSKPSSNSTSGSNNKSRLNNKSGSSNESGSNSKPSSNNKSGSNNKPSSNNKSGSNNKSRSSKKSRLNNKSVSNNKSGSNNNSISNSCSGLNNGCATSSPLASQKNNTALLSSKTSPSKSDKEISFLSKEFENDPLKVNIVHADDHIKARSLVLKLMNSGRYECKFSIDLHDGQYVIEIEACDLTYYSDTFRVQLDSSRSVASTIDNNVGRSFNVGGKCGDEGFISLKWTNLCSNAAEVNISMSDGKNITFSFVSDLNNSE